MLGPRARDEIESWIFDDIGPPHPDYGNMAVVASMIDDDKA